MKVNIGKYPKGSGHRKISVEIDNSDVWSFDHTLAHIIYPALLQLKEQKQGVPSDFVNDVGGEDYVEQDSFEFYKETHQEAFNEKCKELIRGEVRQLFENAKIEKGLALYNFAFHLTSELIFDNMPIGRFQFALNRGVKESEQNYLDYLRDEYQIKAREVVNEDKPKTIN